MKNNLILIFMTLLFATMFIGCISGIQKEELTGEVITKDFNDELNENIKKITIEKINVKNNNLIVNVVKSEENFIKITAQESFFEDLKFLKQSPLLKIQANKLKRYITDNIYIQIGIDNLSKLDLSNCCAEIDGNIFSADAVFESSGNTKINISELDLNSFNIELSGLSKLQIQSLICKELIKIDCSGDSTLDITSIKCNEKITIDCSGLTKLNFDNIKNDKLKINFSGSSKFECNSLEVNNFKIDASGDSNFKIKGTSKKLECEMSGESKLYSYDFVVEEVYFDISGAGKAEITINEKLSADLSGNSIIKYKGNPSIGDIDISGKSKIENVE